MARKSRGNAIIEAINEYLIGAVKGLEPITDKRLMKVAKCARATFYKYMTKGSEIEMKIVKARGEQQKYVEFEQGREDQCEDDPSPRKRLEQAEAGNRELLALFARMTDNLLRLGVRTEIIQAAQREAIQHPDRRFSHAGKGRGRK